MSSLNLPDKIFGTDTRLIVLWLEPIGLGLVMLFSMILVILPKMNEIPNRAAEIKKVKAKTNDIAQKVKYLRATDQESIKNNALKLSMGLLPEKSAYLLVGIVRNVAARVGYAIDDFSLSMMNDKKEVGTKKTSMNFDKLPVLVTLIGPTDKYIELVKLIERSLPIMSIESLDARDMTGGISSVKLGITAYYLPEIGKINYENLSLADLTPTQDELNLLLKINEYKIMSANENVGVGETMYNKYDRQDPFFIP